MRAAMFWLAAGQITAGGRVLCACNAVWPINLQMAPCECATLLKPSKSNMHASCGWRFGVCDAVQRELELRISLRSSVQGECSLQPGLSLPDQNVHCLPLHSASVDNCMADCTLGACGSDSDGGCSVVLLSPCDGLSGWDRTSCPGLGQVEAVPGLLLQQGHNSSEDIWFVRTLSELLVKVMCCWSIRAKAMEASGAGTLCGSTAWQLDCWFFAEAAVTSQSHQVAASVRARPSLQRNGWLQGRGKTRSLQEGEAEQVC